MNRVVDNKFWRQKNSVKSSYDRILCQLHPLFARVKTLIFAIFLSLFGDFDLIQIAMATSNELENVGERYTVKDVKAKVQVDTIRISKELKVIIEFFFKIILY